MRGAGRGIGGGAGQGAGSGGAGGGAGRMGGKGLGLGGECVCPACKEKEPHERGVPCNQMKCPKCGQLMTREA